MRKNRIIALVTVVVLYGLVACQKKADMAQKESTMMSTKMEEHQKMEEGKMESEMKESKMEDGKMESEMKDSKMEEDKMESEMKDSKMEDGKMESEMKDSKMEDGKMESEMKDSQIKAQNMSTGSKTLAPDFSLMDLDGNMVTLSSLKGKKVYLKYWASWCSICLAGLEDINILSGKEKDYEIITIVSPNARGEKDAESFKKWFSTLGYDNIKVLLDMDGKLAKEYGIIAYPTSIYIDTEGNLAESRIGHNDNQMIMDIMKNNVL